WSVAVGDFNNDSRLDVVTAKYGSGGFGILLGYEYVFVRLKLPSSLPVSKSKLSSLKLLTNTSNRSSLLKS
ncbi:unnamed protein product, partial [Rotaria sp. Silwood1]